MPKMKITAVRNHLIRVYRSGNRDTRLLIGNPGIGKTAVVRQAAADLDIDYRSYPATVLDPLDIGGLPVVRPNGDGRDHAYRLPFADLIPGSGSGILVFEDLTTAPPLTQASLYSLTWDRKVGSFALGDDWLVVATANPDDANAATQRMPTPLVNRMEHLFIEEDFEGWESYMAGKSANALVRAFLHCTPQCFVDFDPHRPGPFPTARSWEACANLFDCYAPQLPPESAIAGWIGDPVALQLIAFAHSNALLVSPDEVFVDPAHAPIPEKLSSLIVLLTALANAVRYETCPSFFAYVARMSDEMGIYAARSAIMAQQGRLKARSEEKNLFEHKVFIDYAQERAELLQ